MKVFGVIALTFAVVTAAAADRPSDPVEYRTFTPDDLYGCRKILPKQGLESTQPSTRLAARISRGLSLASRPAD
jgi:hypothetical protein